MTRLERKIWKLKGMFPKIDGIKEGEDWGASKGSIHLGNAAEGGMITVKGGFDMPAADYYDEFGSGDTIRPELREALGKMGYFIEWHDAGTLIACPN
jgi:hypothetical protein